MTGVRRAFQHCSQAPYTSVNHRKATSTVKNPQAAESARFTIKPSSEAIGTGNDQLGNDGQTIPRNTARERSTRAIAS